MDSLKKILFLPDLHCPYHDRRALELFLEVGSVFKPDVLVVMGDLVDAYKISSFSKDPRREFTFTEEIQESNLVLDRLDSLSASEKIYVEGNHEDRLRRYLMDKAPDLFGLVTTQKLLRLDEREYSFVGYKTDIQVGKLFITHDVGTAGRYSVFRAADTYQHPIVMAHTHRLVGIVEGNATGESFPAYQFGWLGDIERVDYTHQVIARRFWSLAFGIGYMEDNGVVHLQGVPIVRHGNKARGPSRREKRDVLSCVVAGTRYVA